MPISMSLFLIIAVASKPNSAPVNGLLNQNLNRNSSALVDNIPMGRLRHRVGERLSIHGRLLDTPSVGMVLRVDSVNTRQFSPHVDMLIEGGVATKSNQATITGYESLRMVGTPPALGKGNSKAKDNWRLQSYFVAISPVRPSPSKQISQVPELSGEQRKAIEAINRTAMEKGAPIALKMEGVVKGIYTNMLSDHPDEQLRQSLAEELSSITSQLLTVKGASIRDTVGILTAEQKQMIKSQMKKPGASGDLSELIAKTFGIDKK